MHSVADDLRREDREAFARLPLEERVRRVFEMGEIGLEAFRQAQGVDRRTAIRLLQRRRQAGRQPSRAWRSHRVSLLARVSEALKTKGIPHVLVGASALTIHGVNRSTIDVDLFTVDRACLDPRTWDILASEGIGVEVRKGDPDDPLAGVVRFELDPELPLDVVVGKHLWQRRAIERAETAIFMGVEVPALRGADLILLKLYAGWSPGRLGHPATSDGPGEGLADRRGGERSPRSARTCLPPLAADPAAVLIPIPPVDASAVSWENTRDVLPGRTRPGSQIPQILRRGDHMAEPTVAEPTTEQRTLVHYEVGTGSPTSRSTIRRPTPTPTR